MEELEITASNRKRKRPKVEPTSVKKRNVKRRLFKETPAAKEFIQDEAEESGKNLNSMFIYPFIIRYYPLLSIYYRLLCVSQLLIHFLGSDEEQSVSGQSNATDATDSITSGATDED